MGKKKIESKKKVDQGGAQSKTARASMMKGKGKRDEGFIASGEMDRVISLNGGEYIYLLDPRDGRTHHLRVGSPKYQTVVTGVLTSNHGERVRVEMVTKGFPLPDDVMLDA